MNQSCGILGKKLGMTQVFNPDGTHCTVTAVEVGPCVVVQKRTAEKDGYVALQIGFEDIAERKLNRAEMGVFSKSKVAPKRYLREFRVSAEEAAKYEVGQEIRGDIFEVGQKIDVTGVSIGKGFAGVMKTYGFAGGKASHGVHESFRHGGALGANMTPGRVFKGRKMAGHHSNHRVTVQNVEVVRVFADDNIVFIKGPLPGSRNTLLQLKGAVKGRK